VHTCAVHASRPGKKKGEIIIIRKQSIVGILVIIGLFAICLASACMSAQDQQPSANAGHTITDMAGREVTVPAEIRSVLCTSPPSTMLVYMIAPERLLGWNSVPTEECKPYIPEPYASLPEVGGWFGKQTGNYETFISMNPDIVLEGFNIGGSVTETINERQQKMGVIPVVGVEDTVNSSGYAAPIRFAGELFGEEERAASMIDFYEDVLFTVTREVATIPEDERVRVYYAEGPAGLQTDPTGSQHSELITLCGGYNVADCAITPGYGRTEVSMEQVISWNPEVILVGDPAFYQSIENDPLWQEITAVKTHRVYMIPTTAFCWFDRPPGINRIIGIPWTAKTLYPDRFEDMDLNALVREFHELYFHITLTDDQIGQILDQ
jgi:iron complex transport system substrate-binding protein